MLIDPVNRSTSSLGLLLFKSLNEHDFFINITAHGYTEPEDCKTSQASK